MRGGGVHQGRILAVEHIVSVGCNAGRTVTELGWTYASVRVDAAREGVGQIVEGNAGQDFLESVSEQTASDMTLASIVLPPQMGRRQSIRGISRRSC